MHLLLSFLPGKRHFFDRSGAVAKKKVTVAGVLRRAGAVDRCCRFFVVLVYLVLVFSKKQVDENT